MIPFLSVASSIAAALLVITVSVHFFRMTAPSGESPDNGQVGNATDETLPSTSTTFWSVAEGYEANTSLLACLSEITEAADASQDVPEITDGAAKIIFRDEASGTYYTVSLGDASLSELERLTKLIETSTPATSVKSGSDAPPYSLWITFGDGIAVSPYLPYESGSVFYGAPADYAPEYLPSESFAAFLEELIRENAD